MRKRLLAGLLALVLMASVFAGCTPTYEETLGEDISDTSAQTSSKKPSSSSSAPSSKASSSSKAATSSKKTTTSADNTDDIFVPDLQTKRLYPEGWKFGIKIEVANGSSDDDNTSSGTETTDPGWSVYDEQVPSPTSSLYGDVATALYASLKNRVWSSSGTIYDDIVNNAGSTTLWPYGAYLEAAGAAYAYDPNNDAHKAEYIKALDNVMKYKSSDRVATGRGKPADRYLALTCAPNAPEAEIYYDDDIWIVKEFLHAYELLNDNSYLVKAQKMLDYILETSWNDSWGGERGKGGLEWMDRLYMHAGSEKNQKNTCINAPAADACLEMYEIMKEKGLTSSANGFNDEYYLQWGQKIYDWTLANLTEYASDGKGGIVINDLYDKIIDLGNGAISTQKGYKTTYNYGMMVAAGARLYRATGDQDYLAFSVGFADAATNKWLPRKEFNNIWGNPWKSDISSTPGSGSSPWFNSYLVEGCYTLSKVDAAAGAKYVKAIQNALAITCMYKSYGDGSGWVCSDWTSTKNPDTGSGGDLTVMNQSANARVLFMIAKNFVTLNSSDWKKGK